MYGHRLFSATEGHRGFRGPAILIRQGIATAFNVTFLGSVRWVAAIVPGVALLVCVHVPLKRLFFCLKNLESSSRSSNFSGLESRRT